MEVRRREDALLVNLRGELDLHTAEKFRQGVVGQMRDEPRLKHLVLLMEDVEFVDSSGVGAILGRYREISERGGRVIVVGLKPRVAKIFQLSGMTKILSLVRSELEAFAAVEGSGL